MDELAVTHLDQWKEFRAACIPVSARRGGGTRRRWARDTGSFGSPRRSRWRASQGAEPVRTLL